MNMLSVMHIVGARPNFVKAAPVIAALSNLDGICQRLVHTGQHYSESMSRVFFLELGLPRPDINLEVGSGTHAVQTARVMSRFEEVVLKEKPDLALVYGDVNSTLAAALVCSKLNTPVGHIEAGLRSFDRSMPEEINRLLTDQIADLLFTPSVDGDDNLLREGIPEGRIHLVGNIMIDSLVLLLPKALARWDELRTRFDFEQYGLVTLHRPSNVDDPIVLASIMETLRRISRDLPLVFPTHPRTRRRLEDLQFVVRDSQLHLVSPMSYLDFLALQRHATLVITDSGSIQGETTYLEIPCLTVRKNTEHPITVELGTNILVGQDMERLCEEVDYILRGKMKRGRPLPLWDGHAAERTADVIETQIGMTIN